MNWIIALSWLASIFVLAYVLYHWPHIDEKKEEEE